MNFKAFVYFFFFKSSTVYLWQYLFNINFVFSPILLTSFIPFILYLSFCLLFHSLFYYYFIFIVVLLRKMTGPLMLLFCFVRSWFISHISCFKFTHHLLFINLNLFVFVCYYCSFFPLGHLVVLYNHESILLFVYFLLYIFLFFSVLSLFFSSFFLFP